MFKREEKKPPHYLHVCLLRAFLTYLLVSFVFEYFC